MATITMQEIEEAIDHATEQVSKYTKKTRLAFIAEVINPLQAILRGGIAAGLKCNEARIQKKFAKMERAVKTLE